MAAQVKGLTSSNNSQAIRNILDDSDDTYWMSNGSGGLVISVEFNGHAEFISLVFQRGFQPKAVKAIAKASALTQESVARISKLDSKVKIPLNGACKDADTHQVDIMFEESYDPYGRICIYTLAIE